MSLRIFIALGLALWFLFVWGWYGLATPDCGIEGTDWYYACTTGQDIDLTPVERR